MNRRRFLATTGAALAAAVAPAASGAAEPRAQAQPAGKARFRTGLVAYSYRQALQNKTMTYEDLIRIAVETGTDGIDMTSYWLPNTTDSYLLSLRRLAWKNRVEIYSVGTRVSLAQPAGDARDKQLPTCAWVDGSEGRRDTPQNLRGAQPAGATLEQAVDLAAERSSAGLVTPAPADHPRRGGRRRHHVVCQGHDRDRQARRFTLGRHEPRYRQLPPRRCTTRSRWRFRAVSTHIKVDYALDDGSGRTAFDWDRIFNMFAAHGFRGYMGLERGHADPSDRHPGAPAQAKGACGHIPA
jgi:hypothetical protein